MSTTGHSGAAVQSRGHQARQRSTGSTDMAGYQGVISDGDNSRDSWSSMSSNVVVCPSPAADQPWSSQYYPPTQYSHHHHLYSRAHRHTWAQVETNQSRCHQVYPQQSDCASFGYINPRPQTDHYHRFTSSVHPYHQIPHHSSTGQGPACRPAIKQEVIEDQASRYQPPTLPFTGQQQHVQHGLPASVWINHHSGGTSSGSQVNTYDHPHAASQTLAPWYGVDDHAGSVIPPVQNHQQYQDFQQRQQQHAGLLYSNGSDVSLSNDVSLPWSPGSRFDTITIN